MNTMPSNISGRMVEGEDHVQTCFHFDAKINSDLPLRKQ